MVQRFAAVRQEVRSLFGTQSDLNKRRVRWVIGKYQSVK